MYNQINNSYSYKIIIKIIKSFYIHFNKYLLLYSKSLIDN